MTKVLVVYGSRHGGTRGIAERIGEVLRTEGLDAEVAAADQAGTSRRRRVRGRQRRLHGELAQGGARVHRVNEADAGSRPLWLFSSGPLPGSTAGKSPTDPLTDALGPADGPGSGGRKKIDALSAATHPRDHRVFLGAFDPKDPPRAMSERLVRMMPASKNLLPAGDFRDWEAIEAWSRGSRRPCGRRTPPPDVGPSRQLVLARSAATSLNRASWGRRIRLAVRAARDIVQRDQS